MSKAVGLGHKPGEYTPGEKKYTTSDYIIPPKVPQLSNSSVKGKPSAPGNIGKKNHDAAPPFQSSLFFSVLVTSSPTFTLV